MTLTRPVTDARMCTSSPPNKSLGFNILIRSNCIAKYTTYIRAGWAGRVEVHAGNVQLERELITDWLADVCEPMEYIVCQLVGGLLIPEMH